VIRRGTQVAFAVVVLANLGALVGVARNRSGAPDATVVLDERELGVETADREASAILLRLRYQTAFLDDDPPAARLGEARAVRLLDQARLEALGFDCSVPANDGRASSFYRDVLPRPALVVFAVGGPEWEREVAAWQERRRKQTETLVALGQLANEAKERARADVAEAPRRLSRLMPVDAGRDGAALRGRYPDRTRFLILPAVVTLHWVGSPEVGGPSLHGHLGEVFPLLLDVPRALRVPLDSLREPPQRPWLLPRGTALRLDHTPRYAVDVSVGRAYQPWITGVRALP
jgi:hypothetical protein